MRPTRIVIAAATLAALAGGTAVAVAATQDDRAAERAVLSDAAERLDVKPDELRSALAAAQDAQLDAEVKAGRLSKEQADAIKARRRAEGTVLGFGHGGRGGHHPGGPGGPRGGLLLDDAAEALGIGRDRLFEQLHDGRTLAEIAKAQGKTLAQVRAAVKEAATDRLQADLKAGRITRAQYDDMVEHLAEHVEHLGERPRFRGHHGPHLAP